MPNATATPPIRELCARYELAPETTARALPEHDGPAFVAALLEAEDFAGAVSFIAHVLPRREAIWWAWTCARRTTPAEMRSPELERALQATERWISEPSDANRPTLEMAKQAGLDTAGGCATLAAFFSGGSIAPAGAPVVEAPEFVAAKVVAGSIMLAAASPPLEQAPQRFRHMIAQGLQVGRRIQLWPPA